MNAVIYARYSSHSQTEQSIEGQLRDNYLWAQQQGISVIAEYIDRATTGTRDTRADFQRMIADAAKKQFQMVIVWKLDRFARNRYDSAMYKAKLKKYGVKVVSVKEAITDSPEGIILEGLLESMAEYYSANLSQNVRRGQRENVSKGRFCGGKPPRGFQIADGKLIPKESEVRAIQHLFEQTAANVPMKTVRDQLFAMGLRSPAGKPIGLSTLVHAVRNTAYIGQYRYGGEIVEGLCSALVDEALFRKANAVIDSRKRAPAAQKAKEEYLLQGKVFCGLCGSPMVGESGKSGSGSVYHYYACSAKKKLHTCEKKNEKKAYLEQYAVQQTLNYVLAPARRASVAKAVVQEYEKEFSSSRIGELEKEIARLGRELDKLVDALIDTPKAARPRINEKIEIVSAQKEDLEADLSRLRIASQIRLTEQEVQAWLSNFTAGSPADPEFCSRIIDTFINSIYVYEDKIIIFYNIRGAKQVTYTDLQSSPVSSDLESTGGAYALKSEPFYIFVNGVFGCVFRRTAESWQTSLK